MFCNKSASETDFWSPMAKELLMIWWRGKIRQAVWTIRKMSVLAG